MRLRSHFCHSNEAAARLCRGHDSRPDIFHLHVNCAAQQLCHVHNQGFLPQLNQMGGVKIDDQPCFDGGICQFSPPI